MRMREKKTIAVDALLFLLVGIIAESCYKPNKGKYHEHRITEALCARIFGHFSKLNVERTLVTGGRHRRVGLPRASSRRSRG